MKSNSSSPLPGFGILALCTSAQAALISNPGFEADTFTTFPGYISGATNGPITGWSSTDDNRAGLNPGGGANPSPFANNGVIPEGTQIGFIQANNGTTTLSSNAGITALTPGATYNLTYRVNSRNSQVPRMGLVVDGQTLIQNDVTSVGGTNPYKYVSVNFTATSATATLSLSNTSATDTTVILDNFSISAAAPKFSVTPWTDDASSGLVGTAIYTHAYNFGNSATNTSINGVPIIAVTGGNPTIAGSFSYNMPVAFGLDANNVTGDSAALANSFVYNNQNATLSLEGLIDGQTYRTSIFTVGWDVAPGRSSTLTANGERLTVDVSGLGNNNGTRIDYEFVASGTTQDITLDSLGGNTFHTYGFTNALVIPEPSSIALVSLGLLGLIGRRRK
jgi:hypothetical protein